MTSRNKTILINRLCGILKCLDGIIQGYYIDITEWSCEIYIKNSLSHDQLEPMSDYCKKKNVSWQIRNYTGTNDWKLVIKLFK